MPQSLTTLVVMPEKRSYMLLSHLSKLPARILTAETCQDASEILKKDPSVRVILTDLSLPDGSWCDVLDRSGTLTPEARVVVCARLADERLWTDVLDAGGFDVLAEPYEEREVERVVIAALAAPEPRRLAAAS